MKVSVALCSSLAIMAGAATAEPTPIQDLSFSDILAVGVANGASDDEIFQLIDEFPNVSAFESKRLQKDAVQRIKEAGAALRNQGSMEIEILYTAAVSQFDFETSSFGVCVPTTIEYDLGMQPDIPLINGLSVKLSEGPFSSEATAVEGRYLRREAHPRDMYTKDFYWLCRNNRQFESFYSSFPMVFKDTSEAEAFDTAVETIGGGYATAKLRCNLDRVVPQGDLLSVRCKPTELSIFKLNDFDLKDVEFYQKFD